MRYLLTCLPRSHDVKLMIRQQPKEGLVTTDGKEKGETK
jgi:hypothetical protein